MGPLDTKLLIADAFVELSDEMPLKRVSISDIVQRTGKNRNENFLKTFWYMKHPAKNPFHNSLTTSLKSLAYDH